MWNVNLTVIAAVRQWDADADLLTRARTERPIVVVVSALFKGPMERERFLLLSPFPDRSALKPDFPFGSASH